MLPGGYIQDMRRLILALIVFCVIAPLPSVAIENAVITVSPRVLFKLDDRLFGQMMERASFGEPGPEGGLIPGTHKLQPSVIEKLRESRPTVLRFPGGTDTDYIDWCDLVDNVPGRGGLRPGLTIVGKNKITNAFGYDEFLSLCDQLKTQPLIVVNFADGLLKRKPLAEAARHAAELVAYCNAPADGGKLPAELREWPMRRAQNGHPRPYHVPLFQIGNETWWFWGKMADLKMTSEESTKWYVTCLEAYVDAMKSVDPKIEIIADGPPAAKLLPEIKSRLGKKVDYVVGEHLYAPFGPYKGIWKDRKSVPAESVTDEMAWDAWVTTLPFFDPKTGMSVVLGRMWDPVRAAGYKAACTEWNNNTWGEPPHFAYARGIAAAGLLHSIMRSGDLIKIASKSMCVGVAWKNIASISADPTGKQPACLLTTGSTLAFYSNHHGGDMLDVTCNVPRYEQPYCIAGWSVPTSPVAALDVLATADKKRVFVHIINRRFNEDIPAVIDLSKFKSVGKSGVMHLYTGRMNDEPEPGESQEVVKFSDQLVQVEGKILRVTLPKRSISIIEIPAVR